MAETNRGQDNQGQDNQDPDNEFGVAFSGGGIRSAAFCSGVLRRLIDTDNEPDYLSCVSGGGYTGSAYVQWKYHHTRDNGINGSENEVWTNQFFEHMRKNAGYICNWQKCGGWNDCFILSVLLVFVAIIIPVVGWGSFACPIAFLVKFFYGQFLDGKRCVEKPDGVSCEERTWFFFGSFLVFVVFHLIEYLIDCCEKKKNYMKLKTPKVLLKLGQLISGASFAFTFFPWFINDFLQYTYLGIRIAIVACTAGFWFFVPVLRKYSSLVTLIYAYSYVVYWHLYEKELFYIKYTEERFRNGMIVSIVMLVVFSVLGDVPLRLVHIYNRWRLQKAFYKNDQDCCGCIKEEQCCHCYDIFPGGHCSSCCCLSCQCPTSTSDTQMKDVRQALTLADLKKKNIKPLYISNVVVNAWRRELKQQYSVVTMSPDDVSVIDEQPTSSTAAQMESDTAQRNDRPSTSAETTDQPPDDNSRESCSTSAKFNGKLEPGDIKLSSAMAMSAAAISPYLGKYEDKERQATHIFTILGMEMAANIVYDLESERKEKCKQFCCQVCVANVIILLPICVAGVLAITIIKTWKLQICATLLIVGIVLGLLLIVAIVWALVTCTDRCCCTEERLESSCGCCVVHLEKPKEILERWCVVHLPICRFLRSLLRITTDGKNPPAMLHLSDGGHFENYGLLPLLKRQSRKILVVHGMEISSDDDEYAKEIIEAMEHARKLFDCSFTSMTGGDVLTDIKKEFVEKPSRRAYKFKVCYSNNREGDIILIAPRAPTADDPTNARGWDNPISEEWGQSPYLTTDDVNLIQGCGSLGCCECCHKKKPICVSCCFKFPRHPTCNQFFTPTMFTTYHREGYRACWESEAITEETTVEE